MEKTHILVVDDDTAILRLLCTNLKARGYDVTTAVDGEESLKAVEKDFVDLILLDIMMPVVDGYHICKILSEDPQYHPVPKIIIITVRREDWDRRISKFGGADAFISKPFNMGDLLEKIKELLPNG